MPPAFAAVGEVLRRLAPRFGLETRLLELTLAQRWPTVVGSQVAAHTRPGRIRFKKLQVFATSSVWVQQLAFLKPALIQRINDVAGGAVITDLLLRVGELEDVSRPSPAPDRAGERAESNGQTAAQWEEAAAHAQAIRDEELRAQLTQVMASALAGLPPTRAVRRESPRSSP